MKILMIRHFATKGNLEKRYLGTTEESVFHMEQYQADRFNTENVALVCCSPKKRCLETADFLFPNVKKMIWEDLKECNFGDFENKNYQELKDDFYYQKWIDSNGTLPFPNGEDVFAFKQRTINAFGELLDYMFEKKYETFAMIVHGGTIMSILEAYATEKKEYFDWQIANGKGYFLEVPDTNRRSLNVCGIL